MSKKKNRMAKITLDKIREENPDIKCENKACGRKDMLTLDHIVPIQILRDMGLSEEELFARELVRILCRPCNSLKGNRLDFSEPRTKKLLLKYLKRL